jgi:hypothetical protein
MNKEERIQIRLTKESRKFLEKLAESEDRSLSQMAGRIIDAYRELLGKTGESFHHDYTKLIKSRKTEDILKAFEYLSKCDNCLEEKFEMGKLKQKIKDGDR